MAERTEEIKKSTIDFYDNFAEKYWARHPKSPERSIEKFAKLLPKYSAKVLDLGCGGGRDSVFFQLKVFQSVCVDLSKQMCIASQEK